MQELRVVAVSEDGTYVVLAQPGRAARFSLPNDERLRAVARGQLSRLAQYEIEVENPLRPKEIQARIRSGETAQEIADTAGVPIERVRWFEGPVLAERGYIAQQAQVASVRRPGDAGPGPKLGDIVADRLRRLGGDPDEARWDSRKRGDGSWLVELACDTGLEQLAATWVFDPRRRHALPDDDNAARLSLPEDALAAAGLAPTPGTAGRVAATVTPFVPRSSFAAPVASRQVPPESEPVPEPARPIVSELEAGIQNDATADITAEVATQGRRAARVPAPQPQPSELPRLQQPLGRTHVPPAPELPRAPGHVPPHASGRPQPPGLPLPPRQDQPRPRQTATDTERPASSQAPPAAATDLRPGEQPAPATEPQPEPPDQAGRPARRAAGRRSRRSSVPTWDEIMFDSSRHQD